LSSFVVCHSQNQFKCYRANVSNDF
jgi:hypothetical protein